MTNRDENEAYLTIIDSEAYAIYFPNGGSIDLKMNADDGHRRVTWLNIASTQWSDDVLFDADAHLQLNAPGPGHWVALVRR